VLAEGAPLLRVSFAGDKEEWPCIGQVLEDAQILVFYSLCPFVPAPERQAAIAEFVQRANAGMTIGNFELEPEGGRVRYKTSIDVEGDRLSVALARRVVMNNVLAMNRYLPGLRAVEGGETADAAIAVIEGS
jgi:hypothetical protein